MKVLSNISDSPVAPLPNDISYGGHLVILSQSFAKLYYLLVIIFSYLTQHSQCTQNLVAKSSPKPLHNVQHHTTKWGAQGCQQLIGWCDGPQS